MRKTVIRHSLTLLNKDIFTVSELKELEYYAWKLEIIANWEWHAKKSTRFRFIYWIRSLVPLLLKTIISNKHKIN